MYESLHEALLQLVQHCSVPAEMRTGLFFQQRISAGSMSMAGQAKNINSVHRRREIHLKFIIIVKRLHDVNRSNLLRNAAMLSNNLCMKGF